MDQPQFHNPYFKKPSLRQRLAHSDAWAYIGSLVLIIILLIWLTVYRRWLWIDYITIEGSSYLSVDQVADAARNGLQEKHWLILPQRFLPLLDKNKLSEAIKLQLEQTVSLQYLAITTDWPSTVHVSLKEYVPGYIYIDGKKYYYIDRTGIVTTEVAESELNPQYPRLRDRNKKRETNLHDQVVSEDFVQFIDNVIEKFTSTTNLHISEFAIPEVTCQTKEYVAEKIFADEIKGSKSESFKEQKRAILNRLQNKEITIDESLTLLEEIKRTENGGDGNANANDEANQAYIQWEAQYVDSPCDYVAVTHDVIVVTTTGLEILFDVSLPLDQQLQNLATVITEDLNNSVDGITSIDVRYEDRVYYR